MSEKREKKKRYNQKLEWIDSFEIWLYDFEMWLDEEPPIWKFHAWRNWKNSRPKMELIFNDRP